LGYTDEVTDDTVLAQVCNIVAAVHNYGSETPHYRPRD